MTPIETVRAPTPAGHYSQAMVHAGWVFVSGQLPIDPQTGEKQLGSIEIQTEQALKNVAAVVAAAGSDLGRVVKITAYIADIALWDRVNRVCAEFFGRHRPARTVVPTRELHYGFQIEIDAIAVTADADPHQSRLGS
jgi:2-iminobutanoate/2-iminopropanoate deaminase